MKHLVLTLVFSMALGWAAFGQVAAPDFLCVSNDTLFWEAPVNSCGPFNAYLIYASEDEGGPYNLLATITDAGQEQFVHENASVGTWYYYLESDYDCPGQAVLQSDTLDNRIPEPPRLEKPFSANGTDVEVTWVPSPSPEVVAYIISRSVPGQGTVVLDTIFGDTFFLDTEASPGERSETYFIEAVDACGTKSLIAEPHSSILLATEGSDPCERSISLSWNLYQGWLQGIGSQEVWVSEDGAPAEQVATLGGNAATYSFQNADDAVEYCFTVRAVEEGTGIVAASNAACITVDVVQAVKELAATNATVNPTNEIQLEWVWNPNAEITDYAILRSSDGNTFTTAESGAPAQPLTANVRFLDSAADPGSGVFYYQVQTTDACGEQVASNIVSTIFLRASSGAGSNTIRWSPYLNPLGTVQGYRLYRQEGGAPVLLNEFGPNTLEATDNNIDLSNPEQARSCYFVEALAEVALADTTVAVTSRSNVACAEQEASIYVPNAFSPNDDGRNDTFRPYLQFGEPADYSLLIYDRYGNQLFESKSIDRGWDGISSKGMRVPVGLYVYHIRIEQADGTVVERSGEVSLLR